jgi:UDP-N-acetylglucosamine--N-acetylmuramyl-(pentapeptide) pyrophosphoryl-undecaprenol N-acetylglucosamine transferase
MVSSRTLPLSGRLCEWYLYVLKIANAKGIPTVLQEQNSYPGITNKLLSKERLPCVAYEGMDRFFERKSCFDR